MKNERQLKVTQGADAKSLYTKQNAPLRTDTVDERLTGNTHPQVTPHLRSRFNYPTTDAGLRPAAFITLMFLNFPDNDYQQKESSSNGKLREAAALWLKPLVW